MYECITQSLVNTSQNCHFIHSFATSFNGQTHRVLRCYPNQGDETWTVDQRKSEGVVQRIYFQWKQVHSHSRIKDRSLVQEVESHSQSLFTLADYI